MQRLARRLVALTLFSTLVASCNDAGPTTAAPTQTAPLMLIADGTSGGGNARTGFYFLPPIVANPAPFAGTFDGTVSAEIRICALTGPFGCGTVLKTFNANTPEPLTVSLTGQSYNANWNTAKNSFPLATGKDKYRLEVWVGNVRLGFADLWFVSNGKELKSVATQSGYVGAVLGSPLTMKFRIETRAIGRVTVSPSFATILTGGTQDYIAKVFDLAGNEVSSAGVQWTSVNTAAATVAPTTGGTTTATGVASVGGTAVTATVGGVSGTALLNVVPRPVLSIVSTNPQTAVVNETVADDPTVKVVDKDGTPLAGVAVTFTPNAGSVEATSAVTGADGRATAGKWKLGTNASVAQSVVVTLAAYPDVDAVTFTATALRGQDTRLLITSGRTSLFQGESTTWFGRVSDAFGNTADYADGEWSTESTLISLNPSGASVRITAGTITSSSSAVVRLSAPHGSGIVPATRTMSLSEPRGPVAFDKGFKWIIDPGNTRSTSGDATQVALPTRIFDELGLPDLAKVSWFSFVGTSPTSPGTTATGPNGSTLVVNESGQFTFFTIVAGVYRFDYVLRNSGGSSTGRFTITVELSASAAVALPQRP